MEEKFSSKLITIKGSFSRTEDSNVEEATIVEESEK